MARVTADRGADRREDTGADDSADAEGGELDRAEGATQSATDGSVSDTLVDGLPREQLALEHAIPCLDVCVDSCYG